jgi:hypothetical protein
MTTRFEIKEEHLKLLSHANVRWQDCEYGAPEIDPKRPYGNSDVEYDIMEILGDRFEGRLLEGISSNQKTRYRKLHKETQTALQIILSTRTMEAGVYERENKYSSNWKKVS